MAGMTDYGARKLSRARVGKRDCLQTADGTLVKLELQAHNRGNAQRARVITQTPLDRLYYRHEPQITWRQWQAGNSWAGLYRRCGFSQLGAMDLERSYGGQNNAAVPQPMQEARDEWRKKSTEMGLMATSVLYWIAVAGYSPREYSTSVGLGKTDGIGVLRLALSVLADLMGLPDS